MNRHQPARPGHSVVAENTAFHHGSTFAQHVGEHTSADADARQSVLQGNVRPPCTVYGSREFAVLTSDIARWAATYVPFNLNGRVVEVVGSEHCFDTEEVAQP